MRIGLNNDWEFTEQWSTEFLNGEGEYTKIRIPHTCKELPLHNNDPKDYGMVCGYRRTFIPKEKGKRVFLQLDAVAHQCEVYLNGASIGTHRGGYTAFRFEITNLVKWNEENLLSVKVDTTEDPSLPPFGFVLDYLGYGGIYREVWLEYRSASYVSDIFVQTPELTVAQVDIEVDAPISNGKAVIEILDGTKVLVQSKKEASEKISVTLTATDAKPWDIEHPNLYTCKVSLLDVSNEVVDTKEVRFGFRTAVFKGNDFFLNGKKVFLRGLNRHQSYPYIGYAAPKSLQVEDARILKRELGCNAVRTSHYPQSHHFINACDEQGLLVFTEFPGWQHIGDEAWKDVACHTLEEMIVEYRNHPSIILWGVRINESVDDDTFYTRTNEIAHRLDPSRQTSGVRYLEKSHLLEDVYSYNDFSHNGVTPGVKAKRDVMKEKDKPLIISECNGHMYPCKPFDNWAHRQEHALRHVRVQNDALKDHEHAGCFGWCMFDYPTHKDFGSGDRICYHGVMDAFRNPKLAAGFFASQADETPVLAVGSSMDIGDYPAGNIGDVYVFTNADTVKLYKNDVFVTELKKSEYTALTHPPFIINDRIGELLESQEGYEPSKAAILRDCLNAAEKYTLAGLPASYKLKLLYCMMKYKLTFEDGVALYGKYVGNWGGEATRWRLDALKDGICVKSVTLCPKAKLHLEVTVSKTVLKEEDTYDMASVRVRIVDENNNIAPYAQLPVTYELTGNAQLVGPHIATLEGGMSGTYIRTNGSAGEATLTVKTEQTESVSVTFQVDGED